MKRPDSRQFLFLSFAAFGVFWLSFLMSPSIAFAQCMAGLPCTTAPNQEQLEDPSSGPNAAKAQGASCDANFMNQLYAKGFLEAEREVVVSNSIIMKPDSVLEYTCFDQLAARTAQNDEASPADRPFFGESDRWSDLEVDILDDEVTMELDLGADALDRPLNILVLRTLRRYVNGSFSHDFLGGAADGDDTNIANSVGGVSNVCDFMFNVYYISKCEDFALNTGFLTFDALISSPALVSTDPRQLPMTCPSNHGITAERIAVAKNEGWRYTLFDQVDTLLTSMRAPLGGAGCENARPIPTGVMVYYSQRTQDPAGNPTIDEEYSYPDMVCSNPACYFDNKGNASPGDDECVP